MQCQSTLRLNNSFDEDEYNDLLGEDEDISGQRGYDKGSLSSSSKESEIDDDDLLMCDEE